MVTVGMEPRTARSVSADPTRAQPRPAALAQARQIFNSCDLAMVLGHATAQVVGNVTYTPTQNPDVVSASGICRYDDLWGGAGTREFTVAINVKTRSVTPRG